MLAQDNAPRENTSAPWEMLLMTLRYRGSSLSDAGSNHPVLLDDPEIVYVLYKGKVDVFAVSLDQGQVTGSRTFLFRAEGQFVLMGMSLEGHSAGLLLTGMPGTQLLKIKQSRLREAGANPEFTSTVACMIENWLDCLSANLADRIPPKLYQPLELGDHVTLPANTIARPRRGMIWIKVISGDLQLFGLPELIKFSTGESFPLTQITWIKTVGDCELEAIDTGQFLQSDPTWARIARFHLITLTRLAAILDKQNHAARTRLQDRSAEDSTQFAQALSRLAQPLGSQRRNGLFGADDHDSLITACQLVGGALGITIKSGSILSASTQKASVLSEIARASHIRTRQVALDAEWWLSDSGPLLAYRGEDKHPVALLPTSARSYELRDPVTQTRHAVTEKLAAELQPFGVSFYRPLPARPINALELIRFTLNGTGRDFRTILAMSVIGGLLGMVTPLITGLIFDTVIPRADQSELLIIIMVLLTTALSAVLFEITRSVALLRIDGRLGASMQTAIWSRLFDLPATFFRDYSAGEIATRAFGLNTIRQRLSGPVITAVIGSLFSVFNLVLLFFYSASLANVALVLVVIPLAVTVVASLLMIPYERQLVALKSRISGMVLQYISGIAKFRVAGAESRAFARWAEQFSQQKSVAVKARGIQNTLTVFNAVYPWLTTIVIFTMIALAGKANLSTGRFLAFNAAFSQFILAVMSLTSAAMTIVGLLPYYEQARPILQTTPEVDEVKLDPGELSGEIEVTHVAFRYRPDTPQILKDVSFSVRPGEFVALVGPSGSGKSTMLRLLLGFEKPDSGAILYDSQDYAELDNQAVRHQIGVVLQNSRLVASEIVTNIIGATNLTVDDAWAAARMVGIDEDIRQMPMGMYTLISEGGSTLSGGQRQRLLIARAIVNKPRILFFDEATSALDNQTQAIVSESLQRLDATRIVIAHRLTTIARADRILVFSQGRIAESGTYAELIKQGGIFADLARRQLM